MPELKARLVARGLEGGGKKAVLLARLQQAEAVQAVAGQGSASDAMVLDVEEEAHVLDDEGEDDDDHGSGGNGGGRGRGRGRSGDGGRSGGTERSGGVGKKRKAESEQLTEVGGDSQVEAIVID